MDQVQAAFPVGATTASTLTFTARARQSAGSGSFSSWTPVSFTDLVVSFPLGRDDVKTADALRDICRQHLMNNQAFVSWWGPETGTIEGNIKLALDQCQLPHAYATSASWLLMFDGQRGPVLAA